MDIKFYMLSFHYSCTTAAVILTLSSKYPHFFLRHAQPRPKARSLCAQATETISMYNRQNHAVVISIDKENNKNVINRGTFPGTVVEIGTFPGNLSIISIK